MQQFVVIFAVVGIVSSGQLRNEYLPPTKLIQNDVYQHNAQFVSGSHPVPIVRLEVDNHEDGSYRYAYQSGDGTTVEEEAGLKHGANELESPAVRGSFSFVAPDGTRYTVSYIADENGFQPQGAHLPTPPPIPEAIQKSLEDNSAAANDNDDGQYHEDNQKYVTTNRAQGYSYSTGHLQNSYLPPRLQQGYRY